MITILKEGTQLYSLQPEHPVAQKNQGMAILAGNIFNMHYIML